MLWKTICHQDSAAVRTDDMLDWGWIPSCWEFQELPSLTPVRAAEILRRIEAKRGAVGMPPASAPVLPGDNQPAETNVLLHRVSP